MTVFLGMIVVFGALAPAGLQAARAAGDYSMAADVAHHEIEEVRGLGFASITASNLEGKCIIDATQPTGYPLSNPTGFASGSTSYSFTTIDNLLSAFPSGATGTLTVAPDQNAPAGEAYDLTATISWTSSTGAQRTYSDSTIMANV